MFTPSSQSPRQFGWLRQHIGCELRIRAGVAMLAAALIGANPMPGHALESLSAPTLALPDSAATNRLEVVQAKRRSQQSDRECGRGLYSSKGHCCARGTVWNGKRCLRHPGLWPTCPRGTIGVYPDCRARSAPRCPTGTTGSYPNCRTTQVCPSGMVGAPPNCQYIQGRTKPLAGPCPPGTTGVPPVCRTLGARPCPPGSVGSGGRCIILQPQRAVPQPNLNLPRR